MLRAQRLALINDLCMSQTVRASGRVPTNESGNKREFFVHRPNLMEAKPLLVRHQYFLNFLHQNSLPAEAGQGSRRRR